MRPGKWMTHRTRCHCTMQFPSKSYIWILHCSCPVAAVAGGAVTTRLLVWACIHSLNWLSSDKSNSGASRINENAPNGNLDANAFMILNFKILKGSLLNSIPKLKKKILFLNYHFHKTKDKVLFLPLFLPLHTNTTLAVSDLICPPVSINLKFLRDHKH